MVVLGVNDEASLKRVVEQSGCAGHFFFEPDKGGGETTAWAGILPDNAFPDLRLL